MDSWNWTSRMTGLTNHWLTTFLVAALVTISTQGYGQTEQAVEEPPEPRPSTLSEAEVAEAIGDLANNRFSTRNEAFLKLLQGGPDAIPALEEGAKSEELEIGMRCVEALVQIARDRRDTADVVEVLERLASDRSYGLAGLARNYARQLKMTDQERVIEALTLAGARLHQSRDGSVFSASINHDRQLSRLKHLPKLQSVNITGNGVTDAGLDHLAKVKTLTSLSINQCGVTDHGLSKLKDLAKLSSISISGRDFSSLGLRKLKAVPSLRSVSLYSSVSDDDLQAMTSVQQIKSLSLSDLDLSRETVGLLNQLKHLTQCNLSLRDASEADFQSIAKLELPVMVNLYGAPKIPDDSWALLEEAALVGLTVSGIPVSDTGLANIAKIKKLKRLQLVANELPITDQGLMHLRNLRLLEFLYLRGADLSDDAVDALKKESPKLRNVIVR